MYLCVSRCRFKLREGWEAVRVRVTGNNEEVCAPIGESHVCLREKDGETGTGGGSQTRERGEQRENGIDSFVDDRKEMIVRRGTENESDRLQCGPSLRTSRKGRWRWGG